MIKLKNFLVVVLSVVMLIMTFSGVANATYSDVLESTPLNEAVNSLVSKKIVKGINENEFGKDLDVTREQMVVFIYRMINDGESTEGGENETMFTDINESAYYTMISWANKEGIIRFLATIGVDHIITDYPDVALRIVREVEAEQSFQ